MIPTRHCVGSKTQLQIGCLGATKTTGSKGLGGKSETVVDAKQSCRANLRLMILAVYRGKVYCPPWLGFSVAVQTRNPTLVRPENSLTPPLNNQLPTSL